MAGHSLNINSTLLCPHGGTVQIISSNTRTKADGAFVATVSDTFIISGCPFQSPVPTPSPCVTVRWLVPDSRVKVNGNLTLSRSSVGLCLSAAQIPQGPVMVVNTQPKVQSM
jgi:hypothetical protein